MLSTRFTDLVGCSVPIQQAFSTNWPNAPHRALRSSVEAAEAFQGEIVGTIADTWNGESYHLRRFDVGCFHKSAAGNLGAFPHLAGESVSGLTREQTAVEIIDELSSEAEMLLRRWGE
jgi:hypothetical protein